MKKKGRAYSPKEKKACLKQLKEGKSFAQVSRESGVSASTLRKWSKEEESGGHTQAADGERVVVGGMIAVKSVKYTRNNEKMCFLTLEDLQGTMEVIVFPKVMEQCDEILEEEQVVLGQGRANVSADGEGKVIADRIRLLTQMEHPKKDSSLWLRQEAGNEMPFAWITAILERYGGETPVYIYEEKTKRKMKADRKFWVTLEEGLLEELKKLLGEKNVAVKNG